MLPDIQPGNTKILYFFNCLLDGMHTKITYICDFSRGGLNTRLYTLVSKSCSEATNMLYLASGVLLVGSSKNQLGDLRKKTGDIEYSGNKILLD